MYKEVITGNLYDLMMYAKALDDASVSDSSDEAEVYLMHVGDPAEWQAEHRARYEDYIATNPLGESRVAGSPYAIVLVRDRKITVGDHPTERSAGRSFDRLCVIHNTEGYRLGFRVVKDGPIS